MASNASRTLEGTHTLRIFFCTFMSIKKPVAPAFPGLAESGSRHKTKPRLPEFQLQLYTHFLHFLLWIYVHLCTGPIPSTAPKQKMPAPETTVYYHKVAHLKGVYCIALNRPASRNAISVQLLKDLEECLDRADAEPTLQVLIFYSSTPNCFCAGADLIERRTMTHAAISQFLSDLRRLAR